MILSRDDVAEVLALLDGLPFDELDLQTPAFRLVLRRDGAGSWTQEFEARGRPIVDDAADEPDVGTRHDDSEPSSDRDDDPATDAAPPHGAVTVRSPIVGTFYRAPRPGADTFVEVGDDVDETTVVGLVETMKLFTSVEAEVAGTVVDIVTANGEAVEQGQVLLHVRPTAS